MSLHIGNNQEDFANERVYVNNNFKIRTCFKFSSAKSDTCKCGRLRDDHTIYEDCKDKWTYENNTQLEDCNYYGKIKFSGCDDLCNAHKFIRFNVIGNTVRETESLNSFVEATYTLLDVYWKVPRPKLIISVIGGFKRMDISTQQKKNFKQGLIDIMKKDRTVIITGGFNVGVHKLVSETVREFRIYHENDENRTHLIGISTWGVVWNNCKLAPKEDICDGETIFHYPSGISKTKGKVALDPNCDCFLFCDDGTEREYDKEVDFRMKFEKYSETQAKAFAIQILFEGGSRAVFRAHETLQNNISIVVLKGSGRAADLISEVVELKKVNLEKKIITILDEYKVALGVKDGDLTKFKDCLLDMYNKYHKQIVIYDMLDSNMKFGKKIVEAIISGQTERQLTDTLNLTIRFNCTDIAKQEVFLNPDYGKIDPDVIDRCFVEVLKDNKYEFVMFFIENDIDIEYIVTKEILTELYEEFRNCRKSMCAELINDLVTDKSEDPMHAISQIVSILSGNILENFYSEEKKRVEKLPDKYDTLPSTMGSQAEISRDSCYGTQDLFLWSLISGRIELAEILWKVGKDHVSSGLIASTILKNLASFILKRGDSEFHKKLMAASTRFEELAFNVLSKAYNENKKKTFIILIRELKIWNNMTCFRIALSSNLLEFLSHSACRSYTTEVWLGGLSPFLSLWKIILTIPFSLFFIYSLIMPSFDHKIRNFKRSVKKSKGQLISNPSYDDNGPAECNIAPKKPEDEKPTPITFRKAMNIFYSAPIVKFYINFASYIIFLWVFAYLNMVELKPRVKIKGIKDVAAEIFVYVYLLMFIIEELRQIKDQDRADFIHKVQAYFSGSCNQLDAFIIFVFIVSTIARFFIPEDYFMICRCLFSISYCMFCLRTMQFYFVYEFVGPKVIMIWNMIRDIVFFLSIFALFIVSFGTLSQSMRNPNRQLDAFLIKDIFQMPYFQSYGELMLDQLFEDPNCNSTNCYFQRTTVVLGFAVYLLLTNILLVNLLIAMFGYTFNQIQDQSGKYWLFIRLQLVEEFYTKPILSPPLNLFYYCYMFVAFIFKFCCCRKDKDKMTDSASNNLLLRVLKGDENIKITGFEQICMELVTEEMQSHGNDNVSRSRAESLEKSEFSEKTSSPGDYLNQLDILELNSVKSFQIRCDKRLERLEMSIERLISKDQ